MTSGATTLLITGANGNIGRVLRQRLALDASYDVTYVVGPDGTTPGGEASEIEVDITDHAALADSVATVRPHAIIHLASMLGAACESDPARAAAVNTAAVAALADAAIANDVARIVFASTAAVYGDGYVAPVSEADAARPASVYGLTKWEAERALQDAAERTPNLTTVVLRIFNVWGESMPGSLVTRLRNAAPDAPVVLNGLDHFVRDYVHVEDVASAVMLAVSAPIEAKHAVFNIGNGVPVSNRSLVAALEEHGPVHYTVGPDVTSYSCADITRAQAELGYSPTRTVGL